jgi:sulfur transfer complex TusBCD TusB component (DsrH family)
MAKYLLIETQDPFENAGTRDLATTVEGLLARGHEVALYLIQNGVMPLRKGAARGEDLARLSRKNVALLADGFSLRERSIHSTIEGVKSIEMKEFVGLLFAADTKAIWH